MMAFTSRPAVLADGPGAGEGKAFTIRPAVAGDAPRLAEIMNHTDVSKFMLAPPNDTAEAWVRRLERVYTYSFVAVVAGGAPDGAAVDRVVPDGAVVDRTVADGTAVGRAVVGMVGLARGASPKTAHTGLLHLMVDPAWHSHGIGTALMRHVTEYADGTLGLHRLELGVAANNPRAQALYERAGFVVEGRKRDAGRQGDAFVDQIDMARIRPV